jgi:hypothetical protein
MERARIGKAKISAFGSARSAANYLIELSIVAASYIGLTESALLLPPINPAATPLWPPTGFALALVLLRGYRVWPAILVGSLSPRDGIQRAEGCGVAGNRIHAFLPQKK